MSTMKHHYSMMLLFTLLFVVARSTVVRSIDVERAVDVEVDRLVDEAEMQFRSDLQQRMARGQTSRMYHKHKSTPESRAMSERNAIFRRSKAMLISKMRLTENEARKGVHRALTRRVNRHFGHFGHPAGHGATSNPIITINDACNGTDPVCDTFSKYRTINGQCNNLGNKLWGSMSIGMRRFVAAEYADGTGAPTGGIANGAGYSRKYGGHHGGTGGNGGNGPQAGTGVHGCSGGGGNTERSGSPLPNPRLVSTTVHDNSPADSHVATHMVTQMGQFLDHDITLTPESEAHECCTDGRQEDCFPINVLRNDSFFAPLGQSCLEFARSTAFCEGSLSVREQMNGITAFIDGSNIYGSEATVARSVRADYGGLLAFTALAGNAMLPERANSDGVKEFFSGDVRTTEMPGLATMHTLFMREHNRIARELASNQPSWNDETLYQEARRIVIAEMQNIVYGEFLPVVLGHDVMKKFHLYIDSSSAYGRHAAAGQGGHAVAGLAVAGQGGRGYDSSVDPSITNSFATAAYRFGHSMIKGLINMVKNSGDTRSFQLKDNYFKMTNYEADSGDGMDQILKGLITQAARNMDQFATEDVTDFLFPAENANFGSDLIARNLQRGRDHGLPGYNAFRKFCGFHTCDSWDSAPAEISAENWKSLQMLYYSPNDVDLFTAGVMEKSTPGGLTGPTFSCLIGHQFQSLKNGDRFFFSFEHQAGSFDQPQLAQLKRRTLRDIICDNTKISSARPNVFRLDNAEESCSDAFKLDIKAFAIQIKALNAPSVPQP